MILALGLPDGGGVDFIQDLRTLSQIPVIVLSALAEEADKAQDLITFGSNQVDLSKRTVEHAGESLHPTPIEFRLLAYLVSNPNCVLTHRQILKAVWGPSHIESPHYVRVYMGHLRKKAGGRAVNSQTHTDGIQHWLSICFLSTSEVLRTTKNKAPMKEWVPYSKSK